MVRGSPYAAGHAGCRNQIPNDSSALDISLGRMASSLDPNLRRGANDLAIQCVATTLLVQVDRSEPLTIDCSGNCRVGCICARQLGTRTVGARTIAIVATCELLSCCNILQLFGQLGVNRPDEMVIGTSRFVVTITPHCSGLEGIGLICAFTGIYLWTCRRELSFPLALLLFPAGMISIWLLNSVRIATLILIGGWDQDIALKGFHSAAGWIFFNMVAVGLVWTSSQSRLFIKAPVGDRADNPATKFLLPLIVFLTASLIARILPPEFYLAVTAVPVLAALWFCRSTLLSLEWKPSWFSALAGCAVFAVTSSVSYATSAHAPIARAVAPLPITETFALLALSLAAGAFAIPIAQELAFRGYLARKLVAPNFEDVPFERFTWLSFVGSSIAFGILEPNWLTGVFAGMIFAAAMYRRGLLSDAIVAHVTSAGLLFALVTITGKWAFLG